MKFTIIALLGAATLAVAHPGHNHARHHLKRGSPVEGRDTVTTTTIGTVVTVYELDGMDVSAEDVEKGLKNGKYMLLSSSVSSATPTSSASEAPIVAFEKKPSTTTSTTPTPTPTPKPTTSAVVVPSSISAAPVASSSAASSSDTGSSSGNIDVDFPSGTVDCGTFPSKYGAVASPWLKLGGWTGVQQVPGFNFGIDRAISYIATAVAGDGCTEGSFCSYNCPAGSQKSQWPAAQGSTGQSIGGLYCNSNNKLELTNSNYTQLCIRGVGGIKVKSSLSQNACICRTDYPGTESETLALNVLPGATEELTNPDAMTYYQHEGAHTSAQYYVNNQGLAEKDACIWGKEGSNAGNWAPVNVGVGKGTDGVTYISLFPNAPTNPDGVLNFTITITGASGPCSYSGGKYYAGTTESATGCTVGVAGGSEAFFEFS